MRHSDTVRKASTSFPALHRAANVPVQPSRPDAQQAADDGAVPIRSWLYLNGKKPLDVAPAQFDYLVPDADDADQHHDAPVSVRRDSTSTQSGDEFFQQFQDDFFEYLQGEYTKLQNAKAALTDTVWKRWFSPKCRRAAAALQKRQNEFEVKILDSLVAAKLREGSDLEHFITMLTPEWCAVSSGFAALAKKASQVRDTLDQCKTVFDGGTETFSVGTVIKNSMTLFMLSQRMYSGVPKHLHGVVKKHICPFVF